MSHYDRAFGAIAAPYDHLHGDLEINFDNAAVSYGYDYDFQYGHGHGHGYMDAGDGSSHEYEDHHQGIDSDASVPDSFASSSPPPQVAVDYIDSSDEDDQDHESASDEEAAAVSGGPYDSAYAYDEHGDNLEGQTESDEELAHDEEDPYGGSDEAHTVHDSYDHEPSDSYSRSSDEEGSVASTVLLEEYHTTQNNAALASSVDGASSPPASPSQDSAESRSDSGLESDAGLGSDQSSPQSSGSGSSSQGLRDPHPRRHFRRPPDQVDIDIHNATSSSSPRRPSLTPTIHPNRRLPRSSQHHQLNQNQHRRRYSDISSSDEEPPNQSGNHDRFTPDRPVYFDLSSDEDVGQDHDADDSVDENEHDLEDEDEDEDDSDHSLESEQSQGAGGGAYPEVVDLLHLQDSDDSDVQPLDRGHRPHQASAVERIAERFADLRARRAARLATQRNRPSRSGRAAFPAGPSDLEYSELELDTDMDIEDDELVEVVLDRPLNARPILPHRQPHRRQHAHRHNHHHNNEHRGGVDVIDLTEEPDSPVAQNHRPLRANRIPHNDNHNQQDNPPPPHRHQGRNPRRQMAQNGRTPSFARSDGSILGNPPAVIDLTSDGPDDGRGDENDFAFDVDGFNNIPANLRLPVPVPDPPRNRRSVDILSLGGFGLSRNLIGLGGNLQRYLPGFVAQRIGQPYDAEVQIIGAMNPDPLAGNPPEFNYQANGFGGFGGRQPTPKPDFEAPRPARPGFTRNTGADRETNEDMVAVCASCDNELKYSADGDDGGPRPAKKARTKKDREEHNFWAVKACGHVRCSFVTGVDCQARFFSLMLLTFRFTARAAMTIARRPSSSRT